MIFLLLSLFLTWPSFNIYGANVYNFDDLLALQGTKEYKEFFDHVKDIPPSKRDKAYKELVKIMGEEYVKELSSNIDKNQNVIESLNSLNSLPELKNEEIFKLRRYEAIKKYALKCFSTQEFSLCYNNVTNAISFKEDGFDFLFDLGEIIRSSKNKNIPPEELFLFYEKAFLHNTSEFYCKKDVLNEVFLPLFSNKKVKIHKDCEGVLINIILESPNLILEHFNFLRSNTSSPLEKAFISLIYLLESFKVGPDLDYSWKELEGLKINYDLREKLLNKVKVIDPLPSALFQKLSSKRESLIVEFIHKVFPEYLNLYVKTCLSYLSGEKEYPMGNPTQNCDSLFKSPISKKFISQEEFLKYKRLKNFEFN